MGAELPLKLLLERLQVASAYVGNSPIVEVGVNPVKKVIALTRDGLCCSGGPRFRRPDKQVNEMLAPLVNQSCYGAVIKVVKASANQRETVARKIDNRCREIELNIKPWFYRVLIRGGYVCKMAGHKRTDVTSNK